MLILAVAIVISAAFLVLLCRSDPKRKRSVHELGAEQGTSLRRLFAAASLLPGIAYAMVGEAGSFLLWLGGYTVAGWLITLAFTKLRAKTGLPGLR
jgi:hypothetical protein